MKVELAFAEKDAPPRIPPALKVVIEGERRAVEKALVAVRKVVEEELPDLGELAYVKEERVKRQWESS